jgi:hypothetical protein
MDVGMKAKVSIFLIAASLLFGIGWTSHAQKQRTERLTWEYKVEVNPNEEKLNQLGTQGWEIAGLHSSITDGSSGSTFIYLKRAK